MNPGWLDEARNIPVFPAPEEPGEAALEISVRLPGEDGEWVPLQGIYGVHMTPAPEEALARMQAMAEALAMELTVDIDQATAEARALIIDQVRAVHRATGDALEAALSYSPSRAWQEAGAKWVADFAREIEEARTRTERRRPAGKYPTNPQGFTRRGRGR